MVRRKTILKTLIVVFGIFFVAVFLQDRGWLFKQIFGVYLLYIEVIVILGSVALFLKFSGRRAYKLYYEGIKARLMTWMSEEEAEVWTRAIFNLNSTEEQEIDTLWRLNQEFVKRIARNGRRKKKGKREKIVVSASNKGEVEEVEEENGIVAICEEHGELTSEEVFVDNVKNVKVLRCIYCGHIARPIK